jgi:hypothetical protein
MQEKGWDVTSAKDDFDREAYAWRHEILRGKSPTLRIARTLLEGDYLPFALVEILDRLNVAAEIRKRPEARLVVVQRGTATAIEEWE